MLEVSDFLACCKVLDCVGRRILSGVASRLYCGLVSDLMGSLSCLLGGDCLWGGVSGYLTGVFVWFCVVFVLVGFLFPGLCFFGMFVWECGLSLTCWGWVWCILFFFSLSAFLLVRVWYMVGGVGFWCYRSFSLDVHC